MAPKTDSGCEHRLLADRLSAMAHPARIGILRELAGCGPCCCKQVVDKFDLAQSTVSQHLKILLEAGLIRQRSEAQKSIYEVNVAALAELSDTVAHLARQCSGTKTDGAHLG